MTREEAIVELELAARFCVNISALSMAQNIANAIAVLREPQIDENGLMPCGCGEKAMLIGLQGFSYECIRCGTTTRNYEKEGQAKEAWNRAMGWRVEG